MKEEKAAYEADIEKKCLEIYPVEMVDGVDVNYYARYGRMCLMREGYSDGQSRQGGGGKSLEELAYDLLTCFKMLDELRLSTSQKQVLEQLRDKQRQRMSHITLNVQEGKWVKVTPETMPEDQTICPVYFDGYGIKIDEWTGGSFAFNGPWKAKYWMKLPVPPNHHSLTNN